MPNVLYFGVVDPSYPRNVRMRRHLEHRYHASVHVVPARIHGSHWRRYGGQLYDALRAGRRYDLVVLSEFSIHFFWASWLAAKLAGAVHVVDFFVGMHETQVDDWGRVARGSVKSRALSWMDRAAILSADVVLTDTPPRARRFEALVHGRRHVHPVPVGAPAWASDLRCDTTPVDEPTLRFLYYGNYLPLHGLDAFVRAFAVVSLERPLHLTLVGSGGLRSEVEKQVRRTLPTTSFTFHDHQDTTELQRQVRDCDVVVGIFGTSEKAAEVVANKVWQGLAAGKVVITRDSVALEELAVIAGERLRRVPGTSTDKIAAVIRSTAAAPADTSAPIPMSEVLERYVQERYSSAFRASGLNDRLAAGGRRGTTAIR